MTSVAAPRRRPQPTRRDASRRRAASRRLCQLRYDRDGDLAMRSITVRISKRSAYNGETDARRRPDAARISEAAPAGRCSGVPDRRRVRPRRAGARRAIGRHRRLEHRPHHRPACAAPRSSSASWASSRRATASRSMRIRALRHPDDRERVLAGFRAGARRRHRHVRDRIPDHPARRRPALDLRPRPRRSRRTTARPIRYSGVDLDITDRKATEAALAAAKEELERMNQVLEQRVRERTAELEAEAQRARRSRKSRCTRRRRWKRSAS